MAVANETVERGPDSDLVPALISHLGAPEDTIRCAAARALGQCDDPDAVDALIDALLDEDPDVRTDAMDALVLLARPQDGETILRSLEGDPVKEVKLAAIGALARLGTTEAVPILRGLAIDKCPETVHWEDEDGLWDDWLDVQLAAIEALGTLNVTDAIPDLLAARTDELGQDIDHAVFAALARMSGSGITTLIDIVTENEGRLRLRALGALRSAPGELLRPLAPSLSEDASADVRKLAIPYLAPDSDAVFRLATGDTDPSVRRDTMAAHASHCQALAERGLGDPDEGVRALALDALAVPKDDDKRDDLIANVLVWLDHAGLRLAVACVGALDRAGLGADRLLAIAASPDTPMEARVAAIRVAGKDADSETVARLEPFTMDPVQQVRTAAFAAIAARCDHDPAATEFLASIVAGSSALEAEMPDLHGLDEDEPVGASRVESRDGQLRISPDGDVIELEPSDPDVSVGSEGELVSESAEIIPFPTSTLGAIGATMPGASSSTDDKDPSPARMKMRRKRVALEGPDDFTLDRPLAAIRVTCSVGGAEMEAALVMATTAPSAAIRIAALAALAKRAESASLTIETERHLIACLSDDDPQCRGLSAMALGTTSEMDDDMVTAMRERLSDDDALVRAAAVRCLGPRDTMAITPCLGDGAPTVRQAAVDVLARYAPDDLAGSLGTLLKTQASDTVRDAYENCAAVRTRIAGRLADDQAARRDVLVMLRALGPA